MNTWKRTKARLGRVALAVLIAGTASPQAMALDLNPPARSFEEERQIALAQHRQILAQFGGEYDNARLAAYVDRVGQKVAANSDMPDKPFRFTVLNTPVVNAFTVGGGAVYVTRGILASINSEAELAALLAHEVGHVTARHTARRETRMQKDRLASVSVGLLTKSLLAFGLAEAVGATARQSYSRDQEANADELGVETLVRAGYDPYAMADMLGALEREVAVMTLEAQARAEARGEELGRGVPGWLQDHPQTADRIRDTTRQADATGIARGTRTLNRSEHLDAIDGILYGEDPALGVVRDGQFLHTGIGIAFDVPERYKVNNLPGALVAVRDEASLMMFSGSQWPSDASLEEYAVSVWLSVTEGGSGGLDTFEETEINGMPALISTKKIDGMLNDAELASVAFRVAPDQVYGLSFVVSGEMSSEANTEFQQIANSFRRLSAEEIAAVKPLRVSVRTVGRGASLEALAGDMAFDDFQRERFEAINGMERITAGDRVKVIVNGD